MFLCLADVAILSFEIYGHAGLFFSQMIKGPPVEKALVCIKFTWKNKNDILSRKLILQAVLLHGQLICYTQISLYPNIQFFIAQERAYQSFLRYFLFYFRLHPSCMLGKF